VRKFSFGRYALPVYAVLAFIYLLIPIAFTFFFSFNDYRRSNITWRGNR
jgi:spermidine/putrescine transport system permease protein